MRKYASAEECTVKKQKTSVRHFGFTEKVYGIPCIVRTMLLWKRHHRNAIMHISFFMGRHSSGSSYIYICISTSYHRATRTLANLSQEGVKCPRAIN